VKLTETVRDKHVAQGLFLALCD